MSGENIPQVYRTAWDDGKIRINVGCGKFPLPFFLNVDADPNVPAEIHEEVPPLPFLDGVADEIWAGHFIEHLERQQAADFLTECYRVLKPGGKLGVIVPDTRLIMERWLRGDVDAVEQPLGKYWNINDLDHVCATFLYHITDNSPHKWSYDADTLARALGFAGFTNLTPIDRYRDLRLGGGAWYQTGFDGWKP